jgi:membrane-associated protease RseP (regulator of RpoE activity)
MTHLPSLQRMIGGLFSFVTRGWTLTAITVVLCAFFAARTASSLIEADVLISTATAAPVQPAKSAKVIAKPKLDPNLISDRNIFCSTCEPERPTGTSANYRGEPALLIATTVADSGARATMRVLSTEVQGSWGLDETVPGVGKLTRIGGVSIDVTDDSGNTKTISLLDQVAGTGAATPDAPAGPKKVENPFEGRIKKLSDGSFEVDRGIVRELVAGGGQGAGAAAMPVVEKGEVKGIRLRGVRPSSSAAAIGLRSGDTLSSIDGEQIKTMEQMLDLYGKLDKLNGLELQGTRAGKPLSVQLRFK